MRSALALSVLALACGSGDGGAGGAGGPAAVCGNMKVERPEDCDPPNAAAGCGPNCRFFQVTPTTLAITVKVNGGLEATYSGFDGDSCADILGAGRQGFVRLEIAGPTSLSKELSCSAAVAHVINVMTAGDYTISATLTEDDGMGGRVMLGPTATKTVTAAASAETKVVIGIPHDTFPRQYQGTLYFRAERLGTAASCAMAMPAATRQRVKLTRGGQVVAGMIEEETIRGTTYPAQALDGQAQGPCRVPSTPDDVQKVRMLDWGPYELQIEATDDAGAPQYCKKAPVFVGAGNDNYIFRFDLAAGPCM